MSLWVTLLGMDETGKEDGIPDEENGRVVPNEVPVPIFRVKLDCKAARIPHRVRTPTFPTNG